LVAVGPVNAAAQKNAKAASSKVEDAAKKGFPLRCRSTDVTNNISVEATLIPAKIGKTIFGKEISNNYAIIALTISNGSSNDSFIVHSIFIDYSQWLLSGSSVYSTDHNTLCTADQSSQADAAASASDKNKIQTGQSSQATTAAANNEEAQTNQNSQNPAGPSDNSKANPSKCKGNVLQPWQSQTFPNQIDSVETRIVRGELLARQPWTTRNWVLRLLQDTGSIAAGFTFATADQSWIRGIGAYNAHFIPSAQAFWPDATVGQMNQISDYGFQVNKAIAKQSSDIVVAFFPIDRFLTPGFRKLFLEAPAIFFSPYEALLDPKRPKLADDILDPVLTAGSPAGGDDMKKAFFQHLPEIANGACDKPTPSNDNSLEEVCNIARLLDRTSLNTVRVIVGGTMTVDVNKVPPQITDVEIDQDKDGSATWKKDSAPLTGVVRGSFLGGGTAAITNLQKGVLQLTSVSEGSNDTQLHFSIKLSEDLPKATTELTFQVSKKSDGSTLTSATKNYTILTLPKPDAAADAESAKVTPAPKAEAQPVGAVSTPKKP